MLAICSALPMFCQWQDISFGQSLHSLHYRSNGNVWASLGDTLFYSLDHGDTFTPKPIVDWQTGSTYTGSFPAIHALSNDEAVLAGVLNLGLQRALLRTDNAGTDYTILASTAGLNQWFRAIDLSQAPVGVIVGDDGAVYRTPDSGSTWTLIPPSTVGDLYSVAWVGGTTYVAGGLGATIRSTDAGLTWTVVPGVTGIRNLVSLGGGLCFATDFDSDVLKSVDHGATWTTVGVVPSDHIRAMEMLDANTLIAAANTTGLYRTTTGGMYWERFDLPDYSAIEDIDFYDADHGIVVGINDYVLRTANGGGPALPMVNISGPTGSQCAGVTLSYSTASDPAYAYQWLVDGIVQSTAYSYDYLTSASGTHTIAVVADNGQLTDTAELMITVAPVPTIPPFQALATNDTLCPGVIAGFTIPVSASGVGYGLWNGGTFLDGESGSGSSISFCCNFNFNTPPDLYVRAAITNACGTAIDTVPIYFFLVQPQPGVAYSLSSDSICYPGSVFMDVQNSVAGWEYSVQSSAWQIGNGGALQLPLSSQLPGFWTTLMTRPVGAICAVPQGPAVYCNVVEASVEATAGSQFALEGAPVDFTLDPAPLLTYAWDFGPGSSPSSFVGPAPPPVSYAGTGPRVVQVSAVVADSICIVYDTVGVTVVAQSPFTSVPICEEIVSSGNMSVADMHVDQFGNVLLGGVRPNTGGGAGNYSFSITKLDSMGVELWTHTHSGFDDSRTISITADLLGGTYATVWNEYASTLQGCNIPAGESLLKFDGQGVLDWIVSANFHLHGLATSQDNTIHVAGVGAHANAQLVLPDGTLHQLEPDPLDGSAGEGCVISIKPNGTVVDAVRFGRYELDAQPGQYYSIQQVFDPYLDDFSRTDPQIDVQADGSLLISGMMAPLTADRSFAFGAAPLMSNVDTTGTGTAVQLYTAVYEPLAGFIDAQSLFGGGLKVIKEVAVAPDGGWYALVSLTDHFAWGDSLLQFAPGQYHDVLVKTDSTGAILWHVVTEHGVWRDIVVKADGSVLVLATVAGFSMMPSANGSVFGAMTPVGDADRMFLHYSPSGILLGCEQAFGADVTVTFVSDEDACGNAHMIEADSDGPYNGAGYPVTCVGPCANNVRIRRVDLGGCGGGCYPGVPPGTFDLSLDSISLDNTDPWPVGPRLLTANVSNWGSAAISSATFAYQLNDDPVQYYNWSGTMAFAEQANALIIGSPNFGSRFENQLKVWIVEVNGTQDDDPWNDTLVMDQQVCPGVMSGTYSLGGVGADIPDFASANEQLSTCGIADNVYIDVADGVYPNGFRVGHIPGSSPTDTVVFRSASGDSAAVRFEPNGYVVLDSTGYVTVMNMSFHSPSQMVDLRNHVHDVNIMGCTFTGVHGWYGQTIAGGNSLYNRTGLRFVGNTFRFGRTGLFLLADLPGPSDSLITVVGNFFDRQFDFSLRLLRVADLRVARNRFYAEYVPAPFGTEAYTALSASCTPARPPKIIENTILGIGQHNIPESSLVTGNYGGEVGSRGLFANNMVMWSGDTYRQSAAISGNYIDIVHNTFSEGLFTSGNNLVIKNNIISKVIMGPTFRVASSTSLEIDDNLFNGFDTTAIGTPFMVGNMSYSLAQWRAFGHDVNSIFLDPQFVGPTDYHLSPGNTFQCPAIPGVATDIDGDLRSLWMPRHGADEGDLSVTDGEGDLARQGWLAPNPCDGHVFISGVSGTVQVHIVDALGRVVLDRRFTGVERPVELWLDGRPGLYEVRITNNGVVSMASLVVLQQ